MILTVSTWLDGEVVTEDAYDIGPVQRFTPAIAKTALFERFGVQTQGSVWCGNVGYRFFNNSYIKIYRGKKPGHSASASARSSA